MSRTKRQARTVLASVVLAALFSAVATQIYGIIVPIANALPLLVLFFVVGLCLTWIMLRLEARWRRTAGAGEDRAAE